MSGWLQMLDVDFEFFDPQPIDYHSIKLLLSQLFSHDAPLLDLGAVTNIVLDQKLVGSTVKTDGAGGDPYAILTILNLNVHKVRLKPLLYRFAAGSSQPLQRLPSQPPHLTANPRPARLARRTRPASPT